MTRCLHDILREVAADLPDAVAPVDLGEIEPRGLPLYGGVEIGLPLRDDGLIAATDLRLDDDSVWRIETRMVETMAALSALDGRPPLMTLADAPVHRDRDKAIFVGYWRGLSSEDKVSFLRRVVSEDTLWRAAKAAAAARKGVAA